MKDPHLSKTLLSAFLSILLLACGSKTPDPATQATGAPPPPPPAWANVIGEYAEGPDTVSLMEDSGELHLFFWAPGKREGVAWPGEKVALAPLTDRSFAMADQRDTLWIRRDEGGQPRALSLEGTTYSRIHLGGEGGGTFRITPLRPPDELRVEALAATPPAEEGEFLPSDLVELVALDPSLHLDIRYATANNFMGEVFYSSPRAFLQRPAAEALVRAHDWLKERGYGGGCEIYCERPWRLRGSRSTPGNGGTSTTGTGVGTASQTGHSRR